MDPNGAEIVWSTLWAHLGPKLMNRCRPDKNDTKEHRKMFKHISSEKRHDGWGASEEIHNTFFKEVLECELRL